MKILITGRNGQLAQALQQRLAGLGQVHVLGREQLDLAEPERIRQVVRELSPDLLVNAAAYTAVDQAENEPALAFAINATAPGVLAEEAARLGVPLLHYSTDYVFDGSKATPYTEDDAPNPLSVYGRSKLAGEQAIHAVGGAHLTLRTSWVYSLHGRNFLLTMQRLLQEKPQLRVVADQIGAPTWAGSLAASTLALIQRWQAGQAGAWGTYHMTAQGQTSWFGFAQAIGEHLKAQGRPCAQLLPIPSSEYPTPAQRPLNSRLDCSRLRQQWQVEQPDWRQALIECLK
ncbi:MULTISPECIES: dTDP-4-dehydrorhamnose reductase [Pseudomonas]|jgi:dTDP-4-dehydrorhamnose reductase|uniref:dTDP-4-dehydrorhamnose reductase n=1 Tax=Pseudomonas putida TaxID=303 RepID=A0A9X8EFV8_PSEPU|nr:MULTISPECIES: dTDP-4-dehydrorhamnose reductase [Pseudomonas]KTC19967.1 dTDP-4-dehydrorhamnose reductase [Pseudomonas putida]MBG8561336.1 dTDP-4-dehydrorhamnose reductase [Pseudomonas qingdaonensis]MCO7503816.1 dTDP-4-dehydrorhamnose reductase [Pseudomonas sp. VE 267-6A]MCO7530237.1 dTDP-4-dehydrorhamnose reductase [Pseudomonas sp. 2]MCP8347897.1 dTDP-4-dehydrorhamnose reductase [Pseudomonas sp. FBF18]